MLSRISISNPCHRFQNIPILLTMARQARALKAGDTIGIAASASPFDRAKFTKGVAQLEKMGFKVIYQRDIFDQNRYLAGTDERRAEELTALIENKDIAAVMFARGGYGSQRIIPLLDAAQLSKHTKPIIGFSDLTALLTYLRQSAGFPTFYGPVITQLGSSKHKTTAESLFGALSSKVPVGRVSMDGSRMVKPGEVEGPVVGGCLSLINSSIGTPYELKADGAILFIEDVNEKIYVLDRMLTQLKNSGLLSGARGIVFGSLVPPADEPHDVQAMLRDVLADFKGPVISDFPAGHIDEFVTLPFGATAKLLAHEDQSPILEYTTGLLA